jgi:hypothetical protein
LSLKQHIVYVGKDTQPSIQSVSNAAHLPKLNAKVVASATAQIEQRDQNLSHARNNSERSKRRFTMFTLSKIATIATLGAFVVGGFGLPARAEELIQNRGPVKAHEPIMTTFGNKGVIAFYEPDGAHCGLYAIVYNLADDSGASAAQVRMSLNAGQIVNLDSPDHKSLSLQCGDSAETLKVVDSNDVAANWPQR